MSLSAYRDVLGDMARYRHHTEPDELTDSRPLSGRALRRAAASLSTPYPDVDTQSETYHSNSATAADLMLRGGSSRHSMDGEDIDDHGSSYGLLDHSALNSSFSRVPSRGYEDMNGTKNGWAHDADSGISSGSARRNYRSSVSSFSASMTSPLKATHDTSYQTPSRATGLDTSYQSPSRVSGLETSYQSPSRVSGLETSYQSPSRVSGPDTSYQSPSRVSCLDTSYQSPSRGLGVDTSYQSPSRGLGVDTSYQSPSRGSGLDTSASSPRTERPESPSAPRMYRANSVTSLNSSLRSPITYGSTFDLSRALDDSEGRRHLLVDRLKDAQDTIRLQTQRLGQVENSAKDASFQVDDLKVKETTMKTRLEALDKERKTYQDRQMESLRSREELQKRIDAATMESATLRSSYGLLQSDNEQKKEVIEETRAAMHVLEEDNNNLTKVEGEDLSELQMINSPLHNITLLHYRDKAKESMIRELQAMKQSLEITRSRNEYLENQAKDTKLELDRLREDNARLLHESTEMHRKFTELKSSTGSLKDENSALSTGLHALNDEKTRLLRNQTEQETMISDLKSTMACLASDKERFFQEKLDLSQKIQSLVHDIEHMRKSKLSADDQLNDLNVDLAQAKLQVDTGREEKRNLLDELSAVKKVGEVLSVELANSKCKLEKVSEQAASLEQTKQIAFQQHDLYEQEIKTLEAQVDNLRRSMDSMRKDHSKDKEGMDDHVIKLKDEMRQVKGERNDLELKCHEYEARIKQTETNLKEHSEVLTNEMDSWKNSCDKLSSSLSKKENDVQALMKKLNGTEEDMAQLKVNHDMYKGQYEEMVEIREEYLKVQEENRRLLQERAENQQVIQLLEMQKDILSKTSENQMCKLQEAQKVQIQYDMLTTEKDELQDKIKQTEAEKAEVAKTLDGVRKSGEIPVLKAKVQELERETKQLTSVNNMATEQMSKLEKEKVKYKNQLDNMVPKFDLIRIEKERDTLSENYKHMKVQLEELEERHHKLLTQRKSSEAQKNNRFAKANEDHDAEVTTLNSKVVLLENSKKRAEDSCTRLENKVEELQQQNFKSSQGQNAQAVNLQKQVTQLQSDLGESKSMIAQQEAVIYALREDVEVEKTKSPSTITQSLEDVGEELNSMRTELQKLMEVIQVKDQEIEELEEQLVLFKKQATSQQRLLTDMNPETAGKYSSKEVDHRLNSLQQVKGDMEDQLSRMTEENDDLSDQVARLTKEKQHTERENVDLRQTNEDMTSLLEEDRDAVVDKLRKQLKAKNRQIESLEEQLQRSTNFEIKKLKRDAGRVEILQAENRRLQNTLKRTQSLSVKHSYLDDEEVLPFTPPSTIEVTKDRLKRLSLEIRQRDTDYLSDSDKDSNHNVVGKTDHTSVTGDMQKSNSDDEGSVKTDLTTQDEFDKLFYESDESDEDVQRHIKQLLVQSKEKTDSMDNGVHTTNQELPKGDIVDYADLLAISQTTSSISDEQHIDPDVVDHPEQQDSFDIASPAAKPSKIPPPVPSKTNHPSHQAKEPSSTSTSSSKLTSKECASENCHFKSKGLASSKPLSRSESKLSGKFPWQSNKTSSNSLTRTSLANTNRTSSHPDVSNDEE